MGAAGNLLRVLTWTQAAGFVAAPFGSTRASDETVVVTGFTKVDVVAPAWRPVRVELEARSRTGAAARLDATVDGIDLPPQDVAADWQSIALPATAAAVADGIVTLRLSASAVAASAASDASPGTASAGSAGNGVNAGSGIEIRQRRVTPVMAAWPLIRHGGTGALFGLLCWALLVWHGPRAPRRQPVAGHGQEGFVDEVGLRQAATMRDALLAGVAVFVVLAVWALGRPPLQSPDEPHQFVRVTAIRNGPWVSGASTLTHDPRSYNPISWGAPPLHVIIATGRPLTRADLAQLEPVPWPTPGVPLPVPPTAYIAVVSYPPLYYLSVFALGESITSIAGLTPYQAFYAFRLSSVFLVALVWTAVYVLLRRMRDTASYAEPILALFVLTPMLAFVSSSVNTDALSIPLITLTALACWRTLTTGEAATPLFVIALLALWTKPSAAQMVGALTVASAWGVWRGWALPSRAWSAVRALLLAAALAYASFYAWSPTQFTFEPGHATIGLAEYVTHVVRALPDVWVSYWGKLGWLDYQLAWPWYAGLLAIVLISAAPHVGGRHRAAAFTQFVALYGLAFFASTIVGGFINLKIAGYMLQGRYFLPAGLALAPLVMHEGRWQRWLLPASVGLVHMLLLWATFTRYYAGDWGLFWAALPLG